MLDFSHTATQYGSTLVWTFIGSAPNAGEQWIQWTKPRGKSMIDILLIGRGGNGGLGVVGAVSTAGGGGGGGSGSQTRLTMPLHLLPDTLYISLPGPSTVVTPASYITIGPKLTAGAGAPAVNDTLMIANAGGHGGNAAAGAGGAAGAAGAIATVGNMPLGWAYATALIGQAGIIGGAAIAGGALTQWNASQTLGGLLVTGGTGGGGLGATAVAGKNGGNFTVAGRWPAHAGGLGGSAATTPPTDGSGGYQAVPGIGFWYGGTGGGSTHGSASGAGLYASRGGNGAYGCGGGGNGGAFTGTTARTSPDFGMGGASICIITCW